MQPRARYGRGRADVYLGEVMRNAERVRQGSAQVAPCPPHVKQQERFFKRQPEAREAKRGVWGP